MLDRDGYRPNVGIILVNQKNEVFWGKRVREHSWQFPQGGMNSDETPEEAMYRELAEETGLVAEHVQILAATPGWLRYRLPRQAQTVRGTSVHVPGADAFLSERQSTVILRCQAEQLRALWRKPDYPGFTPHLTVCDGLPRALSEEILDIARTIPPFSFRVGELQPILSKSKQTTMGLLSAIDHTLLAEIAKSVADDPDLTPVSWAIAIADDYDDATPRVVLTVDDGTGLRNARANAAVTVRIDRPPVADAGGNREACGGDVIVFDGSRSHDPEGGLLRYHWDFGDGTTATYNDVIEIKDADTYLFHGRVRNPDGTWTCIDTVFTRCESRVMPLPG